MPNTPLNIRVPIKGQLLIKLDGFDALHEVGAFTKDINVTLSTEGGNVDFRFDQRFWEETVKDRGVEPPTPQTPNWDKSTYDIVLKVLRENALKPPEVLAEAVLNTLNREGRLSA